jgi:hypothetical protein
MAGASEAAAKSRVMARRFNMKTTESTRSLL